MRVIAVTCLAFITLVGNANASTVELLGRAFAQNSDTLLYSERHDQQFDASQLTLHTVSYEKPDGKVFAVKTATYPQQPGVAQFEFTDQRNGAVEGSRYLDDGSLELYAKKNSDSALKKGFIDVRDDTVVDAGFDRYVAANFDQLLAGDSVKIRFGLPGRQTDYKFLVSKPERVDFLGRKALRAKIRPASRVLSWLVDPITLTYDIKSRRLMMYEGVSNIKTDDGELQTVRIIYYPEENPGLFAPGTPR